MCRTIARKYKQIVDNRDGWVRNRSFYAEVDRLANFKQMKQEEKELKMKLISLLSVKKQILFLFATLKRSES